jgi:hypothetical protein|tara:strand:+ start:747 stop:956 length:210 start_codon:yes stop_codon:yes gene_type:complete
MKDLDEILNKDQESKINWMVGEIYYLKQEMKIIKTNHLHHINEDIIMLKKKLYLITGAIVTFLTGLNMM